VSDALSATLVCCDLIGTVAVDDGLVERAFAEAIATQGIVPGTSAYARSMAQVHRSRGRCISDVMSDLFPDNQPKAQATQLAFERSFSAAVGRMGIAPVPGARECAEKLRGTGIRLCVISDLCRRLMSLVLDTIGWWDRIDLALSADDVARGCPAPDFPLTAMLRLGVDDVRETVVVANTGDGVLAGRRAGAGMVVGILTGPHSRQRLTAAGATHLVGGIAGLTDLLARDEVASQGGQAAEADVSQAAGQLPAPALAGVPRQGGPAWYLAAGRGQVP
jgi:phosphoglycolate phosphatase